jgi:hypothetical protein
MKSSINPELKRVINQQAHVLAALSFAAMRLKLETHARGMLRQGASMEDAIKAVQLTGLTCTLPG